ncbi:MAG: arylsulfatase, partial [Verrucomicrobiota bacterium]
SSKTGMVIRKGDWKYIDQLGSGGFSQPRVVEPKKGGPTGQLYNLEKDPSETTNLYLEYPELVASLKLEIERVVEAGRSR